MYVYAYIGKHHIYFYLNLLLNGPTALHRAATNGHPDTCEVLLINNANVNAETEVSIFKFSAMWMFIKNNQYT